MQKVLILSGTLHKRIWGGHYFRDTLKVTNSHELYGEYWTLSAHPNGESFITNGNLAGKSLSEVYQEYRHLFANSQYERFPLLVKYIDAALDLSVQVHPGDEYALKHENEYGKNEFWYVLNAKKDTDIIIGHNANSKEELIKLINNNEYEKLLKRQKIKEGDYFFIENGLIHAICQGTVILEVQQSSDVTYRLYDYERLDKEGKKRELHIASALDVVKIRQEYEKEDEEITINSLNPIRLLTTNQYFKTYHYTIKEKLRFCGSKDLFYLGTLIKGSIALDNDYLNLGQSFIITSQDKTINIEGNGELIISTL